MIPACGAEIWNACVPNLEIGKESVELLVVPEIKVFPLNIVLISLFPLHNCDLLVREAVEAVDERVDLCVKRGGGDGRNKRPRRKKIGGK